MRRTLLAVLLSGFVLAPLPAAAQPGTDSAAALDTIVVTADRSPVSMRELSQTVDVITAEEIEKSGALELKDVLRRLGVQVDENSSANSTQEGVTIRGFSSSYHGNDVNSSVLVLVDGRRAVGDTLSMASLNNIERVEVLRGPGAMQYGSAAMGGVINIITKRGSYDPNLRLEAGFGSWGKAKTSFFGSGRKDKLDFAVAASYLGQADDYKDGSGFEHLNTDLHANLNAMTNLGWNFNEFHRLGVSVQTAKVDQAGEGLASDDDREDIDRELTSFDLLYEGSTADGRASWLARYFMGSSAYDLYRSDASLGTFLTSASENDFYGAQAQLSYNFSRLSLTGGLDYIKYDMSQNQYGTGSKFGKLRSTNEGDYDNIAAFIIGKLYLLEDRNLVLTAGLRYDEFSVSMDNRALDTKASIQKVDNDFDEFLPSVGLAYSPSDWLKLRANWGQAFKVPTPRQLAGGFYMGSTLYYGDPNLNPEESSTWELGFDLEKYGLLLSGTYFNSSFDNYIGSQSKWTPPTGGPEGTLYVNIEDVEIDGMEWSLSYALGDELGWGASVTPWLNWTHLFSYENDKGQKLANIAEDSLAFGVDTSYEPWGLNFSVSGTYYGAQEIGSFSKQEKSLRQGGATVWDLSFVKRLYSFGENGGDLKAKVAFYNIFDKYYDTIDEVYAPGSSFYVGLIYEMK